MVCSIISRYSLISLERQMSSADRAFRCPRSILEGEVRRADSALAGSKLEFFYFAGLID